MEKAYCTRSLDDLVESLGNAKGKAVVLMGAGCSVSAGIPSATGVVQEIKKHFPRAYARAEKVLKKGEQEIRVDYNTAMANLSREDQRTLLDGYFASAKVNWAHLALAQLLKKEHIKRVLTVNFDSLLIQACGLTNQYPAVYDLTTISQYEDARVADNSILYLNGQHKGFVMLNEKAELAKHEKRFRQVVKGIGTKVIWIVVGYSGEADRLLKVLAEQRRFEADLYWLGFCEEPSNALRESGLLNEGRHAFYVGSQDADLALSTLAQKLKCFPPAILTQPFRFVESLVDRIKHETGGDYAKALHERLLARLKKATEAENQEFGEREAQLLGGEYQKVREWFDGLLAPTEKEKMLGAWAYVSEGNILAAEAVASNDMTKWTQAGERFAQALVIKPDMHEATYNWGNALAAEAKALNEKGDLPAAQAKWQQAGERYAHALAIKPDKHEAAHNWGIALAAEAKALKEKGELPAAQAKWQHAGERYAQALTIKPDMHEAANNWGVVLNDEAKALNEKGDLPAAQAKWQQAGERYAQALAIKPDKHEAAFNWGNALAAEARALNENGDLPAAQAKWHQAGERYAQALEIKPDKYEAAYNWGIALGEEARALNEKGDLPAAQAKWAHAGERFAQALAIKPENHEATNNWGVSLGDEAKALSQHGDLPAAQAKWTQAGERYAQALAIKPDKHLAAYNWAEILEDEALALEQRGDLQAAQTKRAQAQELLAKHPPKANPA